MAVNERRMLGWAIVIALASGSCGTQRGAPPPRSAEAVAVSFTPAPDSPSDVVLAAATGPYGAMPTPRLPPPADPYAEALTDAYKSVKTLDAGRNAASIPILAGVAPALFGMVIVTVRGAIYEIGEARAALSLQAVSKPFTVARAIEALGPAAVYQRVVNACAIDTVALLPVNHGADTWPSILGNLEAFAGRRLTVDDAVYRSAREAAPAALDLDARQGAVSVSARDLGIMGATLANGGRNPLTGVQVVAPATAARVLAILSTAGLSATTGEWLYRVGVPASGGVSGDIIAVVPGRFAVGAFSPPLDPAGNSVRGQRAIEAIVQRLGGNVFAAKPAQPTRQTAAPAPVAPAISSNAAGPPAKKN